MKDKQWVQFKYITNLEHYKLYDTCRFKDERGLLEQVNIDFDNPSEVRLVDTPNKLWLDIEINRLKEKYEKAKIKLQTLLDNI